MLFKELKSHYRMEDMPSGNRHVVETLLYAAILTLIVSKVLLEAVRKKLGRLGARVPDQRFAAVIAQVAPILLWIILWPRRDTRRLERVTTSLILDESVDPNAARLGLLGMIEILRVSGQVKLAR